MLRDGLATEFPSATAFFRRSWPPTIAQEPWLWAGLSGLGVTFVVSALLQLPLAALRYANARDLAAYASSVVAILSTTIGLAFAWRAGGARAVALYLGARLAYSLAALPGIVLFCDRSGEANCIARLAIGQWTMAVGLVAALPVSSAMRGGSPGRHALLSGAGALTATQQILYVPLAMITFGLIRAGPVDPSWPTAYVFAATVASAAVAGIVLRIRSRSSRELIYLSGLILLAWPLTILSVATSLAPLSPVGVVGLITAPAEVVALALARYVPRPP